MSISFERTKLDHLQEKIIGAPLERSSLKRWQLEMLKKSINTAKKSSYFAKKLAGKSVSSLEDMRSIPFTSPSELGEFSAQMVAVSSRKIAHVSTLLSSGTLGEPKRVFFSDGELSATRDFFAAGMAPMVTRGLRTLVGMPGSRPEGIASLVGGALEMLGSQPFFPPPDASLQDALNFIAANKIQAAIAPPAQLFALGRHARRQSARLSFEGILISADFAPAWMKDELSELYDCPVFEHYGMSEMGYGCAVDCRAHSGMHIREAELYIEIVDGRGEICPDGTRGEIVFTTLTRLGMPLIRYRTGDSGMILPGACPCGSALRRLAVGGRLNAGISQSRLDEIFLRDSAACDVSGTVRGGTLNIIVYGENSGMRAKKEICEAEFFMPCEIRTGAIDELRFMRRQKRAVRTEECS